MCVELNVSTSTRMSNPRHPVTVSPQEFPVLLERKITDYSAEKNKSLRARYYYGIIFLLTNLIAWFVRDYGQRILPQEFCKSNDLIPFGKCASFAFLIWTSLQIWELVGRQAMIAFIQWESSALALDASYPFIVVYHKADNRILFDRPWHEFTNSRYFSSWCFSPQLEQGNCTKFAMAGIQDGGHWSPFF